MDTASTLIGLGLLLIFIGPVLLLIYNQNKKNKKRLRKLGEIAQQYKINLDVTELSFSLLLGLDTNAHKLLIVEPKNKEQSLIVGLKEVTTCEVKTIDFQDKPGHINFVSLNLKGKNSGNKLAEIIFYDENDNENRDPGVQLQMAKKWENLIKRQLSS